MSEKKPRILVIGSINVDLVVPVERVPEGGETVLTKSFSYVAGGKGANQAVAAARLGAEVTLCGCVGNDENGLKMIENFKKEGIDTSFIRIDDIMPTGLAIIPVEADGQNRIIVISGANSKVNSYDIEKAFSKEYDTVIMQLEIPLDMIFKAFDMAKERNISVVLDAGPAMKIPLERLKGIDVISPNESEIFALTGILPDSTSKAIQAAQRLSSMCEAVSVVIKMGSRGALLFKQGVSEIFPTYDDIKPVDTTAAGDSFTSSLAVRINMGDNIQEAIKYSHAASSITVSRKGAQPSLPTKSEVKCFIDKRINAKK